MELVSNQSYLLSLRYSTYQNLSKSNQCKTGKRYSQKQKKTFEFANKRGYIITRRFLEQKGNRTVKPFIPTSLTDLRST